MLTYQFLTASKKTKNLIFNLYAKKNNIIDVTLVEKPNVLRETGQLMIDCAKEISRSYKDIQLNMFNIDAMCMQLVKNPNKFSVIVSENMFGDIITDEASVITGSLGMLPSASIGDKISLFEPIHGSYPQAVGKGIANPMAMILSLAMMLDLSFNLKKESEIILKSIEDALSENFVTIDIDSKNYHTTSEVGDWISKRVSEYLG